MKITYQKGYYKPGSHNVMCALCASVVKSADALIDYKGQWQCRDCIDSRPEYQRPPASVKEKRLGARELSPEPADQFIGNGIWNLETRVWEEIDVQWNLMVGTPVPTESDL